MVRHGFVESKGYQWRAIGTRFAGWCFARRFFCETVFAKVIAESTSRGARDDENAQGEAAKITRGVPTVGRISNGAIIEREIEFALGRLNQVRLALRNADFTTAKRIAAAVN